MMQKNNPIGIFDSGMGGLTILSALQAKLPHEHFIYLGDMARLPYGTKSPHIVQQYALKAAQALLNYDIKMLIIACNTASAFALHFLRREFPHLPIFGVIDAGAASAVAASHSGQIGIIATESTIHSGAYEKAIIEKMPEAKLTSEACQLFVPLVEEGWTIGKIPALIIERYLAPFKQRSIDTLVLGCTHFPLLEKAISAYLGPQITLINSNAVANDVHIFLSEKHQLNTDNTTPGKIDFLVTDMAERFTNMAPLFCPALKGQAFPVQLISF